MGFFIHSGAVAIFYIFVCQPRPTRYIRNMKKNLTILLMIFATAGVAQAPVEQWSNRYGCSWFNSGFSIVSTSDGGYAFVGSVAGNDGDVTGWHEGYDFSDNPQDDAWVVKLNASGAIEWQKPLGNSAWNFGASLIQVPGGGFVVAGSTSNEDDGNPLTFLYSDFWIVKLDATGDVVWEKRYGGTYNDHANCIINTNDGGFAVAGHTVSSDGDVTNHHGFYDYWVIKLNEIGELQWQKTYGGTGGEYATSIIETLDGGFAIGGHNSYNSEGNHGEMDFWLVKTDALGIQQWQHSYGGSSSEYLSAVIQSSDGGYVMAGSTNSSDGQVTGFHGGDDGDPDSLPDDFWVVKTDSSGNLQWQKALGGDEDDFSVSVIETADGFVVGGTVESSNNGDVSGEGYINGWLTKLDLDGALIWEKSIGGNYAENIRDILQTLDGGFVAIGSSEGVHFDNGQNYGYSDVWVAKLSAETLGNRTLPINGLKWFPNPVSSTLNWASENQVVETVKLFDCQGRLVLDHMPASLSGSLDVSGLAPGTYIVKAESQDGTKSYKIVKSAN